MRLVEEFRTERAEPERGASEVLSPGFNERTADALDDTAGAATEQSSAMTPTSSPSSPAGEGAVPDLMLWTTALSLAVLSIVLPAVMAGAGSGCCPR